MNYFIGFIISRRRGVWGNLRYLMWEEMIQEKECMCMGACVFCEDKLYFSMIR